MASLPLRSVYLDAVRDFSRPTIKKVPNGDVINITDSYTRLLSTFTSGEILPIRLRIMGYQKPNYFHNQVFGCLCNKFKPHFLNTINLHGFLFLDILLPYFLSKIPKQYSKIHKTQVNIGVWDEQRIVRLKLEQGISIAPILIKQQKNYF